MKWWWCGVDGGYLAEPGEFIDREQSATHRGVSGDCRRCASGARGHGHNLQVVDARRRGGVET